MSEPRLNLNINTPSMDETLYGSRKMGVPRRREPITLESVIRDIRLKKLAPDVEVELIKLASHYPHGALPSFKKNMSHFILNIQREEK